MDPYKHRLPSHLPVLTEIEEILIYHVHIVMKTFHLVNKTMTFQRSVNKYTTEYKTSCRLSSPSTTQISCNCCTEARLDTSRWFQAITKKKQHNTMTVFTSLAPSFIIWNCDWPQGNQLPSRPRSWIRHLPMSSNLFPDLGRRADDGRIVKNSRQWWYFGRLNFGTDQDGAAGELEKSYEQG